MVGSLPIIAEMLPETLESCLYEQVIVPVTVAESDEIKVLPSN